MASRRSIHFARPVARALPGLVAAAALAAPAAAISYAPAAPANQQTPETLATSHVSDWGDDLNAALTAAGDDGKPVLLLFTGSDWCAPCRVLEAEVTGTRSFLAAAAPVAHLVRLDLPLRPGIVTPERLAENRRLVRHYGIDGYPTLLFVGADGRPLITHRDDRTTAGLLAAAERAALVGRHVSALLAAAERHTGPAASDFVAAALAAIDDPKLVRRFWSPELERLDDAVAARLAGGGSGPNGAPNADQRRLETLRQQLAALEGPAAIAHLQRAAGQLPDSGGVDAPWASYRRFVHEQLILALVNAGRIADARSAIDAARIGGMTFQPGSFVAKRVAAVDDAIDAGPEAVERLSQIARNDAAFTDVARTIESVDDAAERLRILRSFDGRPLTAEAEQWRQVMLGFAHEMAGDAAAARMAFTRARDQPDGGSANRAYAQEQLDRLGAGVAPR